MRDTENPHRVQQILNEQLERGAVGITLQLGESLEFSDGVTIVFKQRKGFRAVLAVVMPKDIRVYRPSRGKKNEQAHSD